MWAESKDGMYSLADYDYELPEALIAQTPSKKRDESKLLLLDRKSGSRSHYFFKNVYELLEPSDVLVINNTEVIPGRLFGKKETGGKVELLILDYADRAKLKSDNEEVVCQCLLKTSKRPKIGTVFLFDQGLTAEVIDFEDRIFSVKFIYKGKFEQVLYKIGKTPLPPYIKRTEKEIDTVDDHATYQTVYASEKGAVAAPTAGLHFTKELLNRLNSKGIQTVSVTLHVGYGTFLPVRVSDIREHRMHRERFSLSKKAAVTINEAKAKGSRIIGVGSTSVRTLEYSTDNTGRISEKDGWCDLFIYPGYRFKMVDAMITNFHLPKSTLLMLVSAFSGRDTIMAAYQEAVKEEYRFYSYGDAMLII